MATWFVLFGPGVILKKTTLPGFTFSGVALPEEINLFLLVKSCCIVGDQRVTKRDVFPVSLNDF